MCHQWSPRPEPQSRQKRSLFSLENSFVLSDFESGDGRKTCMKIVFTTGRYCGSAEWIYTTKGLSKCQLSWNYRQWKRKLRVSQNKRIQFYVDVFLRKPNPRQKKYFPCFLWQFFSSSEENNLNAIVVLRAPPILVVTLSRI